MDLQENEDFVKNQHFAVLDGSCPETGVFEQVYS
jgi:hypothetical protein